MLSQDSLELYTTDDTKLLTDKDTLSTLHIIGICASMLAYQIAYSVEFALGNPIMDSTELSVPQLWKSFIWLTGPLSGFIVQPLVGYYSDAVKFKMGRRRPFIIVGCIGIVIGFLLMSYVVPIGKAISIPHSRTWCIIIFVIALALTNISINVLQGPARALIGDLIPKHQQVYANSIGSFMLGVAAVITNFIGGFNLAKYTNGAFTSSSLVILSGCILLVLGVIVTCFCANEEQFTGHVDRENPFSEIWGTFKKMPPEVSRISMVYLLSWMGYFMFQVECTDYVGHDLYKAQGLDYNDGVNFGMLIIGISSILVMIYGMIQDYVLAWMGLKLSYAVSQIIEAVCLFPLFWVKNKYIVLVLLAPLGISCTIFNSVPFAVVGSVVPQDQMGTYMGILNSYAVTGQQLVNWIIGSGLGTWIPTPKSIQLASSSVFAIISAIMCYWIIVPNKSDPEYLEQLIMDKE